MSARSGLSRQLKGLHVSLLLEGFNRAGAVLSDMLHGLVSGPTPSLEKCSDQGP